MFWVLNLALPKQKKINEYEKYYFITLQNYVYLVVWPWVCLISEKQNSEIDDKNGRMVLTSNYSSLKTARTCQPDYF